jgi:hypothetical protein
MQLIVRATIPPAMTEERVEYDFTFSEDILRFQEDQRETLQQEIQDLDRGLHAGLAVIGSKRDRLRLVFQYQQEQIERIVTKLFGQSR